MLVHFLLYYYWFAVVAVHLLENVLMKRRREKLGRVFDALMVLLQLDEEGVKNDEKVALFGLIFCFGETEGKHFLRGIGERFERDNEIATMARIFKKQVSLLFNPSETET